MENPLEVKKSDKTFYIIGIIVVILAAGLFTSGFGLLTGRTTDGGNAKLEIGNSPVIGNPNAPITIYEFSDFSCPFCAAAAGYNQQYMSALKSNNPKWQAPMPLIEEQYVKNSQVKIVFKYFPGHGTGKPAHLVAFALQEQNLFWEFHDQAFKNQADVSNLAKMKEVAKQIGANMTQLENSLNANRQKYEDQLKEDTAMGKAAGVGGTPSFIINGKKIEGAASFSEFKKVIDAELK